MDRTWLQWFGERVELAERIQSPYVERLNLIQDEDYFLCVKPYPAHSSLSAVLGVRRKQFYTGLEELDALQAVLAATHGLQALRVEDCSSRCRPDELLVPHKADGSLDFTTTQVADAGIYRLSMLPGMVPKLPAGMSRPVVRYLEPELAQVFALGETLYVLLCNRPPFQPVKEFATLRMALSETHEPPQRFRAELLDCTVDLLNRCLSRRPEKRPPTLAHLARELEFAIRRARFSRV
jgi:hypothetical protein